MGKAWLSGTGVDSARSALARLEAAGAKCTFYVYSANKECNLGNFEDILRVKIMYISDSE